MTTADKVTLVVTVLMALFAGVLIGWLLKGAVDDVRKRKEYLEEESNRERAEAIVRTAMNEAFNAVGPPPGWKP